MTHQDITLSLPADLVRTLQMMAMDRDEAVGDLVRGMLDREVMRIHSARATVEARRHRVSRLKLLLAPEISRASGWSDLKARFALYGVELRCDDGGLMLHDFITREPLCTSAALGFAASELAGRFGGPLPAVQASAA